MKQVQRQQLQQRLSPQQIQLMRLLQLPVTELASAIKEEVEKNPLLEVETAPAGEDIDSFSPDTDEGGWGDSDDEEMYDYRDFQPKDPNVKHREFIIDDTPSLMERLRGQLSNLSLSDQEHVIAEEILGNLDDAGYLNRDISLISNDLAYRQNVNCSPEEVGNVLRKIQTLDPSGIAARNLQECLLLQVERLNEPIAQKILQHHFDDFAGHRYQRLFSSIHASHEEVEHAIEVIQHLNPKPGGSEHESDNTSAYITPDVILYRQDDRLDFTINDGFLPHLTLDKYYTDLLQELQQGQGDKQTVRFLQGKKTEAETFINLLEQRHSTIELVMQYLLQHQRDFLLTGNPATLQPLRQREVAKATGLDISTVSRMVNSKYLQTDFGVIPLKDCFSKSVANDEGEEVAVKVVKEHIKSCIDAENKQHPLSDDAICKSLAAEGYPIARRTVAKYREQMGIPVARLRRLVLLILLLISTSVFSQKTYYDSIIEARMSKNKVAAKTNTRVSSQPKQERRGTGDKVASDTATDSYVRGSDIDAGIYMASLWYNDFPSHRVNPYGRNYRADLPDEINIILVRDSADFCFPVEGHRNSPYGWRWNKGHHGVDINLRVGDDVRAAFTGAVRVAGRMGGYGNCVVIRHSNGLETLYGHLSKISVHKGQIVSAGEVIGAGGSTGNSTGPHLHFECRFMYQSFDPEWILDFENYSLRTRRLHLDRTYFGIRKPMRKDDTDYKADGSKIAESPKRRKPFVYNIDTKAF